MGPTLLVSLIYLNNVSLNVFFLPPNFMVRFFQGITYSIMSASWDPEREGDVLGTEEFSRNIENIKSGLSRSRENAVLRDRMSEIPPSEFANLEKKEAAKEKRQQSFEDKFGNELE